MILYRIKYKDNFTQDIKEEKGLYNKSKSDEVIKALEAKHPNQDIFFFECYSIFNETWGPDILTDEQYYLLFDNFITDK